MFRCFVQMSEYTIMRSSVLGGTMTLVSGEVKFIQTFAGDHHSKGVKVKHTLSLEKL